MKIWYQSYAAIASDPRFRSHEEFLKRHVPKVARPDTQVVIHGVKAHDPKMDNYQYFIYLHKAELIENALRAEQEGYDAFILVGALDLGFFELKGLIDMPVLFSTETCLHVACLLAPKFGVIPPNEVVLQAIDELIKRYGLQERSVPSVSLGEVIDVPAFQALLKGPPGPVMAKFTEVARKVIKQGAGILVPGMGGLSMFLVDQGVKEIDGVPILDLHGTTIKMAELMVDLKRMGITRSKQGPYRIPSKEELIAARKLYGVI